MKAKRDKDKKSSEEKKKRKSPTEGYTLLSKHSTHVVVPPPPIKLENHGHFSQYADAIKVVRKFAVEILC